MRAEAWKMRGADCEGGAAHLPASLGIDMTGCPAVHAKRGVLVRAVSSLPIEKVGRQAEGESDNFTSP